MDSTLIRKDVGEWPDLDASPAKSGVIRWLELGGRLLVVTSDEGHRPFRQLLAQITPEKLRDRVMLSVGDGAAIYMPVTQRGGGLDFCLDKTYHDEFSPTLPHADRTLDIACKMAQDFVIACSHNDQLLSTITPQSRREAYRELIAQFSDRAGAGRVPLLRAGLEELSHSGQVFDPMERCPDTAEQ